MSRRYLIDGYNLIHALGILPSTAVSKPGLGRARQRLIELLATSPSSQSFTIVFDASQPPPGNKTESVVQGMRVLVAVAPEEADDLIETLLAHDAQPHLLTVVSNDHRLHDAARRNKAQILSCSAFLDVVDPTPQNQRQAKPSDEKDLDMTESEKRAWEDAFREADDQGPEWFRPY